MHLLRSGVTQRLQQSMAVRPLADTRSGVWRGHRTSLNQELVQVVAEHNETAGCSTSARVFAVGDFRGRRYAHVIARELGAPRASLSLTLSLCLPLSLSLSLSLSFSLSLSLSPPSLFYIALTSPTTLTAGWGMHVHTGSGVNLRCEVFVDEIASLEILHQTLNVYVGHRSALKMEGYDAAHNTFSSLEGLRFQWALPACNASKPTSATPLSLVPLRNTTYKTSQTRVAVEDAADAYAADVRIVQGEQVGAARAPRRDTDRSGPPPTAPLELAASRSQC
jgi:hypothetical protein